MTRARTIGEAESRCESLQTEEHVQVKRRSPCGSDGYTGTRSSSSPYAVYVYLSVREEILQSQEWNGDYDQIPANSIVPREEKVEEPEHDRREGPRHKRRAGL